jgi:hypothetical protein
MNEPELEVSAAAEVEMCTDPRAPILFGFVPGVPRLTTVTPFMVEAADKVASVALAFAEGATTIEIPVAKTAAVSTDVIFRNMCIPFSLRALP